MKNIIKTFYHAFEELDAETMVNCYHKDVTFYDPAFGFLKGEKAKNMWRMLCDNQKGKNFIVKASDINYDDKTKIGTAHWEAKYIFSQTGRKVHNIINAEFEFRDGKIIKHTDIFNLHKWAKQALGLKGILLGGTNFFKEKLNVQTKKLLIEFEKKEK
jgi:ketosteroid isomerase-like protein